MRKRILSAMMVICLLFTLLPPAGAAEVQPEAAELPEEAAKADAALPTEPAPEEREEPETPPTEGEEPETIPAEDEEPAPAPAEDENPEAISAEDENLEAVPAEDGEPELVQLLAAGSSDTANLCGSGLTWEMDSTGTLTIHHVTDWLQGGYLWIGGTGRMDNYDESGAATPWARYRQNVRKVVIEAGATYIGTGAFAGMPRLQSVEIPETVTELGASVFSGSGLTQASIHGKIAAIPSAAFSGCANLRQVIIEYGGTAIDADAFRNCASLNSVTIPASVRSIDESAFTGCGSLTEIRYSGTEDMWSSLAGTNAALKNVHVTYETRELSKCGDKITWSLDAEGLLRLSGTGPMWDYSVKDPAPWDINRSETRGLEIASGITSIGANAFTGLEISKVTIPDTVTRIGAYSFFGTGLTDISIPDGVVSIGQAAFNSCPHLACVLIPRSVTSIEMSAFTSDDALETINVDSANPSYCVDDGVLFSKDKTTLVLYPVKRSGQSYTVPEGVTVLENSAFGDSTLREITLPGTLREIGDGAFSWCESLQSLTIPESVTSIGAFAFSHATALKSLTLPAGIRSIGDNAFQQCTALESFTVPDAVESIGGTAFGECTALKSVTLPVGIKSIGESAFNECKALTDVYYGGTTDTWKTVAVEEYNAPLKDANLHCNGYRIVFDANGGQVDTASKVVTSGGSYGTLPVPVWRNHDFLGWFTEKDGGTQVTASDAVTLTAELTLYAHWSFSPKTWAYPMFSNSSDDFFRAGETQDYSAGSYFDHFSTVLSQYYQPASAGYYLGKLRTRQSSQWKGSCFGFAALEGAINEDLLPVSVLDPSTDSLPEVDMPRNNTGVRNLLNYYYLTQLIPDLRTTLYSLTKNTGRTALLEMAEDVAEGHNPYMFSYFFGSSSGHALILESGQKAADGSYTLVAQDNRFHGYTRCRQNGSRWEDTGEPLTATVTISANGENCVVSLDSGVHFMRDGVRYHLTEEIRETVKSFEATRDFTGFAAADPTGTVSMPSLSAEPQEGRSILYYEPDDGAASNIQVTSGSTTVFDSANPDESGLDYWYIVNGSTLVSSSVDADGFYTLKTDDAPTGWMVDLSSGASASLQSDGGSEYVVKSLSGGTVSYAGSDGFVSVSADNAQNIILTPGSSRVIIPTNEGNYSISVADENKTVVTVAGSGSTNENSGIEMAVSSGNVMLDGTQGNCQVAFAGSNGQVSTVINTDAGTSTLAVPEMSDPEVSDAFSWAYTAKIQRNGSAFTLSVTPREGIRMSHNMRAWQAVYDESGRMTALKSLDQASQSGGVAFSGEIPQQGYSKLFILTEGYAPVIKGYRLSNPD